MESVVALFKEPTQAASALNALQERGFDRDRLGFTLLDTVSELDLASSTGVSPEQGAPGGMTTVLKGAGIGLLGGLALTLPFWLLILAFPATRVYQLGGLYGMLFGAIGGVALGALFGALAGSDHGDYVKLLRQLGLPAAVAEKYYASLKDGNVLVIARDEGTKTDEAIRVMQDHGAVKLDDAASGRPDALGSERTVH